MSRTGTVSLSLALETLGYRVLHDFKEMQRLSTNLSNGFTDDTLFESYDAFLDFNHPVKVLNAVVSIPDSKIIYTLRPDNSDWINSCLIHVLDSRVARDNNWNEINVREMLTEKSDIETRLTSLNIPADRLLFFNVIDGWRPLCDFLDKPVPVPPRDFPSENGSVERLERVLTFYRGRSGSSVSTNPVNPVKP